MSETTNLKLFKHDNPTTNTNNFDIEKALNENWDKLDAEISKKIDKETGKGLSTNDFTNEYKKKLDTLNNYDDADVIKQITNFNERVSKVEETTAQNSKTITAIQEEQTTQNENIEKNATAIEQNKKAVDEELTKIKKENSLLKSQIPQGTASGNSIHLEDSSNMPFEWKLRGGSRQETTEGYNLLNVENDFKVTNLEANKVVEIHLKANVTYTIKCDEIETDNTELKSCLFRFQYDSADVANPYARIPIATKTTTYTPPEDINSVRIYSGTSHNESATTNTTFKNLMIYEGTENKPYEHYTGENPSPSLEYPSKIKNVENDVKVTVSNKNLYKIEKVINDTNYSKIIYKDENGNVSFTTGGIPLIIAPTKTKEKTEYTYILKCKSNVTTENNINFTGIYEDGTSELLSANKKKDTNEFIVKFKTNKEKTLAYVTQKYTNSARTTIITEGTMILEGDYLNLDEPYEIHQEQEIIFPLAEGQKLYEGSYLAKDEIHQVTKMINIDIDNYTARMVSEGLLSLSNSTGHRWNYISIKGLCSHFKNANNENITANESAINNLKDNEFNFRAGATKDRIYFKNSSLKTLDDWKNFFKNNDVMLAYEVEEEIIPYTPEQQAVIDKILYTYKNVTNISVDNDLAILDITYKKDIETMFNNQAKEYNERLSNIENLLNTTETSALLLDNLENDLKKEV